MNNVANITIYGRTEVRQALHRNFVLGLATSVILHLAILSSYYINIRNAEAEPPKVRVKILKYSELGPPPSIANNLQLPAIGVSTRRVRPIIGVPVPVPDIEVNPEQTIATQNELSKSYAFGTGYGTGEGGDMASGGEAGLSQDITIEEDETDPELNAFVPVEKGPAIITSVHPQYPEIARLAGIEGVVWVKVLVGKDGKPKRAVVIKEGPTDAFNQAAIDAAMQYSFTPAVMNSGPVSVWLALKFRFQLREHQS